jgi:anti-sigma B factor antagonist
MPAIPFGVEVRGSRELATIALHGDVDVAAEAGLGGAYTDAVALGAVVILLDFADAAYINSTGIALIVRLLANARRDHREVRAIGLSPHYVEVFRITRLSDYVQILDDPASAGAAAAPAGETGPEGQR